MNRSSWRLAALLGGALLILAIAGAVSAHNRHEREQAARDLKHREYLARREFTREYRESKRLTPAPASQRRRCDIPDTETVARTANARIYETNYRRGEVDSDDPTVNRVFACQYETGTRTDLGINDTMSGNSFGIAEGAGDYLAYTTAMWLPADGSADCFFVVNLRTQKPVHGDPGCNNAQSSQTVFDVALTDGGSFAYSTGEDRSLRTEIVVKSRGDSKARVVDVFEFDGKNDIRLLQKDGLLQWFDSEQKLRTVRFQ